MIEKDKLDQILDKVTSFEKGQKENSDEIRRVGVKLEQLGSDIKAVAEGHGIIRQEVQEMKSELKADIKLVDDKAGYLAADVRQMKTKVDKIDRMLDEHVKQPARAV